MKGQVAISKATALADSIQIVKQAEAISLEEALGTEVKAMEYVQDTMQSNQDTAHLLTFVWLRLIERKIETGVRVEILIDNPLFSQ